MEFRREAPNLFKIGQKISGSALRRKKYLVFFLPATYSKFAIKLFCACEVMLG